MASMPMEHVLKLLDIVAHERSLAKSEKNLHSIFVSIRLSLVESCYQSSLVWNKLLAKWPSMPMKHILKLLDIVAHERSLAKSEKNMYSIRKELCREVNEQYDYATLNSEYFRQYSLYRTFRRLQEHGFTFKQETKFFEATETQWNQQVSIDSTVAQLRDVELTIVDKWEQVFDKMPVPQNKPKILKENVYGQVLMKWHPSKGNDSLKRSASGDSRRTSCSNSRRYHPYSMEVESITGPLCRCITRLRSFNNLPSYSYIAAINAMTKYKDIPGWLCDEPDEILLLWLVSETEDKKRGEMKVFMRIGRQSYVLLF